MDGVQFDDRDFFRIQQQEDRGGTGFLFLAILLHLVVFAASVWLPDLLDHKPLLDDIVTVDLVSMPEPLAPTPEPVKPVIPSPEPVVKTPPKPVTPPPEPEAPEVVAAPEPEIIPEPVAPTAPISLAPRKRKIRKAKDTRLAEEKEKEVRKRLALLEKKKLRNEALARKRKAEQKRKQAEQLRKKQAIEARLAEREAAKAAALAREEVAFKIRQSEARGKLSASTGRKVESVVVQQYLSSLVQKMRAYWILPEMRQFDPGLEAIVVFTVRRDGSVVDMQFERKSGDSYFDQFVLKALRSASPMPRFPAVMSQANIEVGLRFKPGELAM